jgi:hypothetical protein
MAILATFMWYDVEGSAAEMMARMSDMQSASMVRRICRIGRPAVQPWYAPTR